jgi:hypothetical protein
VRVKVVEVEVSESIDCGGEIYSRREAEVGKTGFCVNAGRA